MARRKTRCKPLGTIWEIPDDLWEKILPILSDFWPKKPTGRRVANWRDAQRDHFRMRNGCQWEQLPRGSAPRAPSTTGSSGGSPAGSSRRSGRSWSPSATNWRGAVGLAVGRRDAGQGPVRGGKRRARTHRSRQERDQEEPGDRRRRRPAGRGDRRGQHGRSAAAWRPRSRRSSSSDPTRRRWSRTCAWTRGMTTRRVVKRPRRRLCRPTSGGSARRRRRVIGRAGISRGAGWRSGLRMAVEVPRHPGAV